MENDNQPRNRRQALTELNDSSEPETPKSASPDELVIIQRGPRRKPITWSPFDPDTNRNNLFVSSIEKTPERVQQQEKSHRVEIKSKLRRRLILTPEKHPDAELGEIIAKKLKSLPQYHQ